MRMKHIPTGFMANQRHTVPTKWENFKRRAYRVGRALAIPIMVPLAMVGAYTLANQSTREELFDTIDDTAKYISYNTRFNNPRNWTLHYIEEKDTIWDLMMGEIPDDDSDGNGVRNARDWIYAANRDSTVMEALRKINGGRVPVREDSQLVAGTWMMALDLNQNGCVGH